MNAIADDATYLRWVNEYDSLTEADRSAIRRGIVRLPRAPLFSLVVLPTQAEPAHLPDRRLASLHAQLYPHWQAFVPQSAPPQAWDHRVIRLFSDDTDPAAFYNAALDAAAGGFVIAVPAGAELSEHALYEIASVLSDNDALDLVFTDEDCINASGQRCRPWFKTAWDPDLMLGRDAVGAIAAVRTQVMRQLGGMRSHATAELAHYDMMLRLGGATTVSRISHIPAVLCHRVSPAVEAGDAEAMRAIVRAHLAETYLTELRVEPAALLPIANRVHFPLPSPAPLVSVVVPTRDRADMLARCAEGVLSKTSYARLELLIVDNDSAEPATHDLLASLAADPRVRVLPFQGAFNFAAMINFAVEAARGEVVVLLNNDTEIIAPGWLSELVSHAVRPDIGAVGAKLLYPDGRVQHCGVILGPGLFLGHQLRLSNRDDPGPHGELALLRTVSAVTGACMALRKSVFLEVGGLDAVRFKVALNDIDLCLRLGDHGYRIVCTPFAELYHHESATRGQYDTIEKQVSWNAELRSFELLWAPLLDTDPYHNPNLVFGWNETVLAAPPRRPRLSGLAGSRPGAVLQPASI